MSINSSTKSTSRRSEMGHVLDAGFSYLNHTYSANEPRTRIKTGLKFHHDLLKSHDSDFKPVQFWLSALLRCPYITIWEKCVSVAFIPLDDRKRLQNQIDLKALKKEISFLE